MSNDPDDQSPEQSTDDSPTDDSPAEFIDRPENLPGDKNHGDPDDEADR